MSFAKTTSVLALTGLLASGSFALAQGAGGPDVPSDAKSQGTMENGSSSTGMSKGSAMKHMSKKHHMMKKHKSM